MIRIYFLLTALSVTIFSAVNINAQVDEKKFEVGGQFSYLERHISVLDRNVPPGMFFIPREFRSLGVDRYGFGARLTYNLNSYLAVEGETNFFISSTPIRSLSTGGSMYQGQFGVKIGKRYKKFGIFGKVRPGLVHLTNDLKVTTTTIMSGNGTILIGSISIRPANHFSTDVGGVLEFYPSKRVVGRVDVGDTFINFPSTGIEGPPAPSFIPARPGPHRHNLQVNIGLGYRF